MSHLLNRLGGYSGVHEASVLNGLSFDPFSLQQDGADSPEVNIGGCQVADARMPRREGFGCNDVKLIIFATNLRTFK
jgi:hypothetical protein